MAERLCFPLFVDLSEKTVVVIGAGRVAERRIRSLLDFAGGIVVVAPCVQAGLEALAADGRIRILRRAFEPEDLAQADLVIAATDDGALNRRIHALAKERRLPVNVSSDQKLCDFYFPGIARKDRLVVGVTACGAEHARAKAAAEAIRQYLEEADL